MEIKNIQRKERKTKVISIRTTRTICKWMNKNKVSPSKLFNEAVAELISCSSVLTLQ